MCHVVLGLRPRSRQEEADIVLGWLSRQESLGYRVGALWYLVNMAWWSGWSDYVGYQVPPGSGSLTGVVVARRAECKLNQPSEHGEHS